MEDTKSLLLVERQRVEDQLFTERERLRITLASIGDAVISTDAEGRVVFLNAVAEKLTGWKQLEAATRPLGDVFKIVDESTRAPLEDPARQAQREARVIEHANHTLLLARDGSEVPIDHSAAPMRSEDGAALGAVLVFRDVSARKQAEEAQARLAAIVESSEDAIVSKTLDGVILSWNAGAERVFGYTADEAIGKNITLLIPPDRLAEEKLIVSRLAQGQRIEHFETVRFAKGGRHLNISLSVSPVKNREGRTIGAAKIARDITPAKRAEQLLRESESQHRFLSALSNTTQSLTDAGEMMFASARSLAEHLAVERCAYAEVEDESVFVITGDYTRGVPSIVGRWPIEAFGTECQRCMLEGEPYVVDDVDTDPRAGADLEAYRKTNIQAVICVPLHKSGKLTAAMAVHQVRPRHWTPAEIELVRTVVSRCWESIERTRAARELQEAAQRLELAVEAASLGAWSWNSVTDVGVLSARAAQIYGIEPESDRVTSARMLELIHPEDREAASAQIARALADGDFCDMDYRVLRPLGDEVWVSARGRAQYLPNGRPSGMFGVVQDITERKRLEQDLRQRAIELAEVDRKKDEFIALLAHELRNPLAPLRAGLQLLKLGGASEDALERARTVMDRQLSHMVRLIDDLLDVSRMSTSRLHLQRQAVQLSDVVSHALEAVGPTIQAAAHQLHVSLPDEPVVFDADLVRLAQVFGNLLTNSAKYTPKGGQIWLTAEVRGDEAVVSVKDTGIGIPSDALARVFEMFSRVERSVERLSDGLGIGLALAKRLIEAHGGTLSAASPGPGLGSTFSITLPVLRAGGGVRPRSEPAESPPSVARRHIVVVADDSIDGAEAMAELLEALGSEAHVAHDGLSVVALVERVRPQLVLMDVGMPEQSGLDAARQIRQQPWGRELKIVALTGWGQESDRERSRAAGCDGHLVKPIDVKQLKDLLRTLAEPA